MAKKPVVYAVDGNWLLHRVYYTLERKPEWDDAEYSRILAARFVNSFCNDAVVAEATHGLVAFDGPAVFRYDIYPQYKANRRGRGGAANTEAASRLAPTGIPDREVYDWLDSTIAYVRECGIPCVQLPKYEADDVLATIARVAGKKFSLVMGTKDKDCFQLLGKDVRMLYWDHVQKTHVWMDVRAAEKRVGLRQSQFIEYQTLIGDKTDNVPSCKERFGPKTAQKTLAAHGSIAGWYKQADDKTRRWLIEIQGKLKLNRRLVTLVCDAFEFSLADAKLRLVNGDNRPAGFRALSRYLKSGSVKPSYAKADVDDMPDFGKPRSRVHGKRHIEW